MPRRSPVEHGVGSYRRKNGTVVSEHQRGSGTRPTRRSKVVGESGQKKVIESPVYGVVLESRVTSYTYDYKENVKRPIGFLMVIQTSEDPYGHENEEWVSGALQVFPTLDNSIREGYTVEEVTIGKDTWDPTKYRVKIYLKSGVRDIETKEHEAEYMEDIAESTLPSGEGVARPVDARDVIPEEPPRVLNLGTDRVFVTGDLDRDERQGLDLWIEIHRFEPELLGGEHINYNTAGKITSKCFDYLRAHRKDHEFMYDIYKAYRSAGIGIQKYDAEEVAISLSAFKAELERIHENKWKIDGSLVTMKGEM